MFSAGLRLVYSIAEEPAVIPSTIKNTIKKSSPISQKKKTRTSSTKTSTQFSKQKTAETSTKKSAKTIEAPLDFQIGKTINGRTTTAKTSRNETGISAGYKKKPLILLYHKLHGRVNWWFNTTDADFKRCTYKCQVTTDRSLYQQADMVMFECPKAILSNKNGTLRLGYYK